MHNSKICPIILSNYSSNENRDESFQIANLRQDAYRICSNRYGGDYWHPRRVIMDSYDFEYGTRSQSYRDDNNLKSCDFSRSNRYESDYLHSRRVFLNSYKFSEQYSFKDKLKRSMKELNDETMGAALKICKEGSRKRLGIRGFGFTRVFQSLECFAPLLNKKKGR